jgi:hypothetical protein
VSLKKTGCLCMSESRGIDYKHWIRRKNWPFWQSCWERVLWPTTSTAEPDGRAQGRIGSRSSPIGAGERGGKKKSLRDKKFLCTEHYFNFLPWRGGYLTY